VRTRAQIDKLRVIEPEEDLGYVLEAVRLIRRELDGKTPLIGFAGAPFTLASYLIEGGRSSDFASPRPSCGPTRTPGTPS
jgi:uroporphyrinogen decarboxylase